MNPVFRIARLLLILALSIGAPQLYVGSDASAALRLGRCVDQQILCGQVRQPEARVAIVSAREATQASLKSSKRLSLWQGVVLVATSVGTTTEDSFVVSGGDLFTLTAAALSSKPVRAPPASA